MEITPQQARAHRLRAHHLERKLPTADIPAAAGVCGLQNSPPGAWETALFHRVTDCSLPALHRALYQEKQLLQAWSYRGAPVIFPTDESDIFLSPLCALPGEDPWIYTRGITGALDILQMGFEELLPLVKNAAAYLQSHTVKSKEELDRVLAAQVEALLPAKKQALWNTPSIYGRPDRQTIGEAAVSFLLRPCSFNSLVVFGERIGPSPTFTSFENWVGRPPRTIPGSDTALIRKFLHCHGPSTKSALAAWLGCSPRQAERLWAGIAEEIEPVRFLGRTCWILSVDRESFLSPDPCQGLLMLGPHDPYLDISDRTLLLEDPALQRSVWRTVANPGALLKEGRVIGIWKNRAQKNKLSIHITLWETLSTEEQNALRSQTEEYSIFQGSVLEKCLIEA